MADDPRAVLARIRERAEKATEGPWKLWGMSVMADPVGNSSLDDAIDVASTHMAIDRKPRTFDAEFIAQARADVPRMASALEAALAWCDKAEERWQNLPATADTYQQEASRARADAAGDLLEDITDALTTEETKP